MSVTFNLPEEIEQGLRERYGDLNQAAKEATLLELYRREELSHFELSQALGLNRMETEALLASRRIYAQTLTHEDLEEEHRALDRVLGPTP